MRTVQSPKSNVQSQTRIQGRKGWIPPQKMIVMGRRVKVALACLLAVASLSLVSNRMFRGFNVAAQSGSLGTPANLGATDNEYATKVAVTWDAVRGATLYRVFRNTTN